ncbi:MAG: class I SAM-dependent methyltransferase [Sulfurimonas sp.]
MDWTQKVVDSRVEDGKKHQRYPAGSPNEVEIKQYAHYLPKRCEIGVVMGMTPELRNVAVRHCDLLVSIDCSFTAIETYKDWLDPAFRDKEKIIHGDWNDLEAFLDKKPGFIVGDGIFGNIHPLENYMPLLRSIRLMLDDGGSFVTRQCLMPEDVGSNTQWGRSTLLQEFRSGMIDEAEFGLSMRLQGYVKQAYDEKRALLDNKKVFACIESDYQEGLLSKREYEIIHRYFFQGINTIPTRSQWEGALNQSDFFYESHAINGKQWYAWYPVYHCKASME